MNTGSVGSPGGFWRSLALAIGLMLAGAGVLQAQATGKLEGRIRDQAGAPVAGAQIRVEGSAFGAVADSRGYYFINNLPAGSIDVIAAVRGLQAGAGDRAPDPRRPDRHPGFPAGAAGGGYRRDRSDRGSERRWCPATR